MDNYILLASSIIDKIEEFIITINPDIKTKVKTYKKYHTLLYGEAYYELEDSIAALLKEKTGGR